MGGFLTQAWGWHAVFLSYLPGSAFGAAAAGAVLFGLLSVMDTDAAAVFSEMVRRGPGILRRLPAHQQVQLQYEIATASSLRSHAFPPFVACAARLPMRRI